MTALPGVSVRGHRNPQGRGELQEGDKAATAGDVPATNTKSCWLHTWYCGRWARPGHGGIACS